MPKDYWLRIMVRTKGSTSDPASSCPRMAEQQQVAPGQRLLSHRRDWGSGPSLPGLFLSVSLALLFLQVAVEAIGDRRHLACDQRQGGKGRSPASLGILGNLRDTAISLWGRDSHSIRCFSIS